MMSGCASGTTYYVKNGGNDGLDGLSDGNAWETIAKVNTETQAPSDTVQFNKGDTFNDAVLDIDSGTVGNNVTYTSYGTGDKPLFNQTGNNQAIYASEESYFIIDGLQFDEGDAGQKHLQLASSNNWVVRNCDFTGNAVVASINVYLATGKTGHDILIEDCTWADSAMECGIRIFTSSTDSYMYNITIQDNSFTNLSAGRGWRTLCPEEFVLAGSEPRNIISRRNTYTNIWSSALMIHSATDVYVGYETATTIGAVDSPNINALQLGKITNGIVEYNMIDGLTTSVPDGNGIIVDWSQRTYLSDNVIVRNNIISNCDTKAGISVYAATNTKVYNNIVFDCEYGIMNKQAICTGTEFYNNTVYNITEDAIYLAVQSPLVIVKNNLLHTAKKGIGVDDSAVEPTEDYNSFYNMSEYNMWNYTDELEIPIGDNSITDDPLLGSNYTLNVGSPCIGTGLAIDDVVSDYRGAGRILNDMGAMAYATFIQDCVVQDCTIN